MIRICVVCEGATEVEFVNACLAPHLLKHGAYAYPTLLRAPSGRHRGGRVTVDRLARFISHQYREADRITTLVDRYGFQDADGCTRQEIESAILHRVEELTTGFDRRFVRPYIQMYEFEALLFSDIGQFEWVLDGWSPEIRRVLEGIRSQFPTPEEINDHPETAPSKRILAAFPKGAYSKVEHGPIIAEAIGLDVIRLQCPQFNAWIEMLETWNHETP